MSNEAKLSDISTWPRVRNSKNASADIPVIGDIVQYFHAEDRPPLASVVTAPDGDNGAVQLATFWPGSQSYTTSRGVQFSATPKANCWRWPE